MTARTLAGFALAATLLTAVALLALGGLAQAQTAPKFQQYNPPLRAFMRCGQQLLDRCEGDVQDRKVCEGYIIGFADAWLLYGRAVGAKGCIAETTNKEEVITKVLDRLRNIGNSMRREHAASALVDMILNSCPEGGFP